MDIVLVWWIMLEGNWQGVCVYIWVIDIGLGIFENVCKVLFKVFYSGFKVGGVGFGLVIVVELLCFYGGVIWLDDMLLGICFCLEVLDWGGKGV